MKVNFSKEQTKVLSGIFANLSVTWFTAGIITPIFAPVSQNIDKITLAVSAIITSIGFVIAAIYTAGKIKK